MGIFLFFRKSAVKYIQVLISLLAFFYFPIAYSASFDCSKAAHRVEKLICETQELSILDVQMARAYQKALVTDGQKKKLRDSQRAWLRLRNACSQQACLKSLYQQRIHELNLISLEGYKDIDKPASKEISKFIDIERVEPNSSGNWRFNNFIFSINYECQIVQNFTKAEKRCLPPTLKINEEREGNNTLFRNDYFLKAGDVFIGNGSLAGLSSKTIGSGNVGGKGSKALFEYLLSNPSASLNFFYEERKVPEKFGIDYYANRKKIIEKNIVLSDFKEVAEKVISLADKQYDKRVEKKTNENILFIVISLAAGLAFLWLAILVVRRIKRGVIVAKSKLKIAKESIHNKRVARVAEDEAVREIVRNSIKKVDDSSLEALREQIKVALNAGDTKVAEELIKILSQLEDKEN